MSISDDFIDQIKSQIRPSDLIGRTVALKRQGREFVGLSPFKKERTPSFFVNDEKGFYHCFASQEHGDVITWLQKMHGLSFMEAVEQLAGEIGLDMPKLEAQSPEAEQQRKTLLEWVALAQAWFVRQLHSHEGRQARDYLESRGLSLKDMETFGLGYSPDNRRGLTQALLQKGAKIEELAEAGLVIVPEDNTEPYDRFRGRVMFPIADPRGRIIAFGGRAMSSQVKAKYLNSPETPLFHKGSILYRYYDARSFAHNPKVKAKGLIVAEGYMDVIAFARAGLGHAVAPLGTAMTEGQIRLLWRAGGEPVICLDGDSAGQRAAALAAERALPLLEAGKTLRFVLLGDGIDPDDLLRDQGPQALRDMVETPKPLIDVLWERELAVEPLDDPDRRAGFRKRLRTLIAKIADGDVKAEYRAEIDRRLDTLFSPTRSSGQGRKKTWSRYNIQLGASPALKRARKNTPINAMLRQLLLAAIEFPEIANQEAEILANLDFGPLNALRDALLDGCLSHDIYASEEMKKYVIKQGLSSDLTRLSADNQAMQTSLGGDEADEESRIGAWRRLSNSYMEKIASDTQSSQDRSRDLEILEQGDSDALSSFVAAHRRNKKNR